MPPLLSKWKHTWLNKRHKISKGSFLHLVKEIRNRMPWALQNNELSTIPVLSTCVTFGPCALIILMRWRYLWVHFTLCLNFDYQTIQYFAYLQPSHVSRAVFWRMPCQPPSPSVCSPSCYAMLSIKSSLPSLLFRQLHQPSLSSPGSGCS